MGCLITPASPSQSRARRRQYGFDYFSCFLAVLFFFLLFLFPALPNAQHLSVVFGFAFPASILLFAWTFRSLLLLLFFKVLGRCKVPVLSVRGPLQRTAVICVHPDVCTHLGVLIRGRCGSARAYTFERLHQRDKSF